MKEANVTLPAAGAAFYAVVVLAVWLLGSFGFSWYVDNFGRYNQTYGALAAVIILLLWLFLPAFAVRLGAERDAEVADSPGESAQRR